MMAAQNGHGGAYRRLLSDVSPWLHRYFRRRLPHGHIDDAVQETLLAIHRRRHTFDPRQPFELGWQRSLSANGLTSFAAWRATPARNCGTTWPSATTRRR